MVLNRLKQLDAHVPGTWKRYRCLRTLVRDLKSHTTCLESRPGGVRLKRRIDPLWLVLWRLVNDMDFIAFLEKISVPKHVPRTDALKNGTSNTTLWFCECVHASSPPGLARAKDAG